MVLERALIHKHDDQLIFDKLVGDGNVTIQLKIWQAGNSLGQDENWLLPPRPDHIQSIHWVRRNLSHIVKLKAEREVLHVKWKG